jgi:hypothetical protein
VLALEADERDHCATDARGRRERDGPRLIRSIGGWLSSRSGLVVSSVVLAVLGVVWPWFVWFRPISIGLAATSIFAAFWVTVVLVLACRHGSRYLWFFSATPFLLYWPVTYAIMVSCTSNNDCP